MSWAEQFLEASAAGAISHHSALEIAGGFAGPSGELPIGLPVQLRKPVAKL